MTLYLDASPQAWEPSVFMHSYESCPTLSVICTTHHGNERALPASGTAKRDTPHTFGVHVLRMLTPRPSCEFMDAASSASCYACHPGRCAASSIYGPCQMGIDTHPGRETRFQHFEMWELPRVYCLDKLRRSTGWSPPMALKNGSLLQQQSRQI